MENENQTTRGAKRTAIQTKPEKVASSRIKAVGLTDAAFEQVGKGARKFKLSKSQYASAAIAYFAKSKMDPTNEEPFGLANVEMRVGRESRATQTHNGEIGNRIIAFIRGWEKSSYAFQQQLQISQNMHLELIESNILQRLVAAESNFLGPIMEQLFKGNVEGYINRCIGERVYLKVSGQPESSWASDNDKATAERDRRVHEYLRNFVNTNTLETPKATQKPVIVTAPAKIAPPVSELLGSVMPAEKK